MKSRLFIILVLFLFLGIGTLTAQNGICELGESPSSPDCNGLCDSGDAAGGPDCDGICDPGDAAGGPDCNGVCDPGDAAGGPDCDGICDPGDAPSGVDCAPLPVELSSFSVIQIDRVIELQWETNIEINNKIFEIERAINGIDFFKIGEVNGAGNSNEIQTYTYMDKNPDRETNYYRLKQIDFNGQFAFSRIRSLDFESDHRIINFYPNPSRAGNVNLNYVSNVEETIEIYLYDMAGKLIDSKLLFVINGHNKFELDSANLLAGIYTILIKNSTFTKHKKLIIK